MTTNLALSAEYFAAGAHAAVGQRRKHTGEPYIVHPRRVAALVMKHTGAAPDDPIVSAAYLHDVVEDTGVTIEDVRAIFGDAVADIVDEVTKPKDGIKEARKARYLDQLARASAAAHTIKLADVIDNTSDVVEQDRGFATRYVPEKEAVVAVLTRGHLGLRTIAVETLAKAKAALASPRRS